MLLPTRDEAIQFIFFLLRYNIDALQTKEIAVSIKHMFIYSGFTLSTDFPFNLIKLAQLYKDTGIPIKTVKEALLIRKDFSDTHFTKKYQALYTLLLFIIDELVTPKTNSTIICNIRHDTIYINLILPDNVSRTTCKYDYQFNSTFRSYPLPSGAKCGCILPDDTVLIGFTDGMIRRWDCGSVIQTIKETYIDKIFFIDGQVIFIGHNIKVFDLHTEKSFILKEKLADKFITLFKDCVIMEDSYHIFSYNLKTFDSESLINTRSSVTAQLLSGHRLLVEAPMAQLAILDLKTNKIDYIHRGMYDSYITCVAELPDDTIACGMSDGRIEIWDWKTQHKKVLKGTGMSISNLLLLPDGTLLVISDQSYILSYNLKNNQRSTIACNNITKFIGILSDNRVVCIQDGFISIN